MSELTIIVAYDAKRGIGINNTLPWRLPEDLARFKRITTGHAIIMGRKTFASIGRPLPNRRNIVLTRNTDWQQDGVEVVNSLPAALQLIGNTDAFIIGGADIYAQALPLCSQLLVTEIHQDVECDAFFPAIDQDVWQETERTTFHSEQNAFDYAFVTYTKIKN
ncbi:dihydrofolate reductase [Solimicrobium silvestre]|uniref:Dihydrofolate reductase n=1 Tax=Solimicrobium silvestre TaxID=2099400 RepID=A0A2S9GU44_9BURK|nr:dihydrofolate reductase [Solimicrobium silvestre]PRC91230.1 Dihydrofolate reductase [Solimicrobium silvestre]